MFGINSKCSPFYEAHPTTSSLFLETIITKSRNTHSSYSTSKITSSVVVKFSKHHEGQIFTSAANKYNHNDWCFKNRLWGSCRQAFLSGHMVRIPTETTYKLPGVGGSFPYSKTLSSGIEKPQCLSQMRQYNSGSVYKQTRGNKITTSVFQNVGSMEFCHRKQHSDQNSTYFRHKKQVSRSVVEKQKSCNRMDMTQINSGSDFYLWGHPLIDLFASILNRQAQIFCSWIPHPQALALDALTISWEGMFAYAYPPICLIPKVLQHMSQFHCQIILIAPKWPRRHWYTDLLQLLMDCPRKLPPLPNLLHQPNTAINHPNPEVFSLHAWLLSTKASKRKAFLASLENSYQPLGGQARRKITPVNLTDSVAGAGKIDPYSASLVQVADFLTHLFHAGLQYRTIAGYRSMLSAVLQPIGNVPVGQHPYIIRLLKGVFNSRPPTVRILPEWDLQLVLDMIQKHPFEPMGKASLKFMTFKAIFLMAISTFRRCGDLQSLQLGEGSVCVQKKGLWS